MMMGMWETLSSRCQETRKQSVGGVDHPVPHLFKQTRGLHFRYCHCNILSELPWGERSLGGVTAQEVIAKMKEEPL